MDNEDARKSPRELIHWKRVGGRKQPLTSGALGTSCWDCSSSEHEQIHTSASDKMIHFLSGSRQTTALCHPDQNQQEHCLNRTNVQQSP